jgi:cytochrome c-type biogenesis protein CcmH
MPIRTKAILRYAVLALAVAATAAASGSSPTAQSITKGIICQCGCNQTVESCNHYQCASRTEMQAMAEKEVAAGKDETTIMQDFVLKYGTKVLAAPPAEGFDLTAWILPGAGALVGLALVLVLVRRWRNGRTPPPDAPPLDPKLLAEVEEEMKRAGMRL